AVNDENELVHLLADSAFKDLPKLVVGGGSNLLFTKDFPGLVILNRIKGIHVVSEQEDTVVVRAGAGVVWHDLVLFTVEHGWGGLENLSLIPGTVGASPIQNIGAYGVEIKDCFTELSAVSIKDGSRRVFNAEECRFGYRDSLFKREAKGAYVITSVSFRLLKHPVIKTEYGAIRDRLAKEGIHHPTISDVSRAVISIRSSKLPDPAQLGNAGSFFKNPIVDTSQADSLRL
ncbi:MAG: UDP-N-acetylmuramate dehydrogenase, partial [Flavobacteriales bacterium]